MTLDIGVIILYLKIRVPDNRLKFVVEMGGNVIINDIIWKQQFVDKLACKHHVSIEEAEEVFHSSPIIRKVTKGRIDNENVYAAYAHVSNGRYLIVFFINKKEGRILPISARDMDGSERKYYEKQKQKQ